MHQTSLLEPAAEDVVRVGPVATQWLPKQIDLGEYRPQIVALVGEGLEPQAESGELPLAPRLEDGLRVELDVGRDWCRVQNLDEVAHPADLSETSSLPQPGGDSDDVAWVPDVERRFVDAAMRLGVEVLRPEPCESVEFA